MSQSTGSVQKPRVIGIVILCILGAIVNILAGVALVGLASGSQLIGIVLVVIGVVEGVAGVLLMMYKRMGVMLGLGIYGLGLVLDIISIVTGQGVNYFSIVLTLVVLYYLYRYYSHEPEKTFFT